MLRNILRTSRWLARRQINKVIPVVTQRALVVNPINSVLLSDRQLSSSTAQTSEVEQAAFEEICSETLESLCDYFEEIVETAPNLKGADVTYSDGVLTVYLGPNYGTYVINRQTPNKQIWLSSPTSGPKRYNLVLQNGGYWIYKHDGMSLHKLLQTEISKIIDNKLEFNKCAHSLV